MPLNIDFLQVLLHMLNFVILAGALSLLLYKPIASMIKSRREYYDGLADENERQAKENSRMKEEYEKKLAEVDREIDEMRSEAEKESAENAKIYIDRANEKAAAIISAAEKEAEDRKKHILESAQTEIGELVLSAAQKLVSDTVTPERDSALYDEFVRLAEGTLADKSGESKEEPTDGK